MNQPTLTDLERMALQAGKILSENYEKKDLQVDYKGVIDLVTEVDHQSEAYLLGEISRLFPGHQVMTEESTGLDGSKEHLWILDPIDGTVNFAHGVPVFSVSLAYIHYGELTLGAVIDPMRNELFTAEKGKGSWLNGRRLQVAQASDLARSLLVTGFPYDMWHTSKNNLENFANLSLKTQAVRRIGSAALDLCYVGAGRFDGYWELKVRPWDIAGAMLVAQEAGALVTLADGAPNHLAEPLSVLAANPVLHAKILAELVL